MPTCNVFHGHGDVGRIQTVRADRFDISHEGHLHFTRNEMRDGQEVEVRVAVFAHNHWSAAVWVDDEPKPSRLTLVPEDATTNDVA